jgi:5'-methylthioadenosine phosphorylase
MSRRRAVLGFTNRSWSRRAGVERLVDKVITSTAEHAEIGIIGGSGLYDLTLLEGAKEIDLPNAYGAPSDVVVIGSLAGRRVAFLARHGRGHRLSPAEIPVRANIYALKSLGVREVISVSAVGSLREDFAPGDLVVPDQIVDRTRGPRATSFFGDGVVVHVSLADPYCPRLRPLLAEAARLATGATVHDTGTYCCMEGPQFSTRAESNLYASWGMDVIGMTAIPEAKLAREAELCYAGLALVTDYDCWRPDPGETVTAGMVAEVMERNVAAAKDTLVSLIQHLSSRFSCDCQRALSDAVITERSAIPAPVRDRTGLLMG